MKKTLLNDSPFGPKRCAQEGLSDPAVFFAMPVDMQAVRQATYLGVSGKRARFCAGHREVAMLNVKDKTCELCDTRPALGVPPKKRGLWRPSRRWGGKCHEQDATSP